MPISLGTPTIVVSYDKMVKLIQMLNVELHHFDTKSFQNFVHKLTGLCVVSTLEDFLNHLDSTSVSHFANIVMSPDKTPAGIAKFLKGTEIEQNYKKIYGPSCRAGMPLVVPKPATTPKKVPPIFVHAPPLVHPGIPAGYPLFPRAKVGGGHVIIGGGPIPAGHVVVGGGIMPGYDIGYGIVVGTPFGPALFR